MKTSLLLSGKERVNLVFYGEKIQFYSLGSRDNLHYALAFYPDLKIEVPGNYGYYRAGALGKLVKLEKKPEILKRSFSLLTNTFTDFYFLSKETDIYYGKDKVDKVAIPSPSDIFLTQSNATLIDRIYIFITLWGKRPTDFTLLKSIASRDQNNDNLFSQDVFFKSYQGYFYQRSLRAENKNIQIIYNDSLKTAGLIGRILEGSGIRVSDMTAATEIKKECQIKENIFPHSKTARVLASFFRCRLVKDKTGLYDILFIVGYRESEWQVQ